MIGSRPTIAIAHLAAELAPHYLAATLARHWRADGLKVVAGPAYPADADVCILHYDRTRIDAAEAPAPPAGKPVLNGAVLDISKRRVSALVLRKGEAWSGPVIVKTDLNHYGGPEDKLAKADALLRLRRALARLHWRGAQLLPKRFYPVLPGVGDVPAWVWSSPDFIVERFMPERAPGDFYSVRGWVFLGEEVMLTGCFPNSRS